MILPWDTTAGLSPKTHKLRNSSATILLKPDPTLPWPHVYRPTPGVPYGCNFESRGKRGGPLGQRARVDRLAIAQNWLRTRCAEL
jgi:hypothetical protein